VEELESPAMRHDLVTVAEDRQLSYGWTYATVPLQYITVPL
jgi:hypothetical protein